MRQAGRSLPEYRKLRERWTLAEIVAQPELCAEVTLQPVRRLGVDAAVMFADIMLPLRGMGVDFELVEDVGPVITHPISSAADVEQLGVPDGEEAAPQVTAGAQVVQLFDSWVGALAVEDYEGKVATHTRAVFDALGRSVPRIHFGTGTAALLESIVKTGPDIVSLDWRVPLDEGWRRLGFERGVQGNLEPAVLLGPSALVVARARDVLRRAAG